MTNKQKLSAIEDALSDRSFRFDKTGENEYEIGFQSDAGEDFFFTLTPKDNKAESLLKEMREYAYEFDPEEHVEQLLEAKRNGFRGVPSAYRLAKDADSIQQYLDEIVEAMEEAIA